MVFDRGGVGVECVSEGYRGGGYIDVGLPTQALGCGGDTKCDAAARASVHFRCISAGGEDRAKGCEPSGARQHSHRAQLYSRHQLNLQTLLVRHYSINNRPTMGPIHPSPPRPPPGCPSHQIRPAKESGRILGGDNHGRVYMSRILA